jgi:hypothetical protein
MFQYKKYNIKTTDRFNPDDFPKVVSELEDINNGIAGLPGLHKEDIIISWLKDHSSNTWQSANPALTELFTSGHFVTTNLESLLECGQTNHQFSKDFEEYIRKNLS